MNRPSLIAVGAKRIGTAGWKSLRSQSIASAAAPPEYLYVPCTRVRRGGQSGETIRWVQVVPIVKKTATLIFYTSDTCDWRKAVVSPGCISRQQFEADTRGHTGGQPRRGYPAGVLPIPRDSRQAGSGRVFFASRKAAQVFLHREERRQAAQAAGREAALIKELRRAMAEAHPDHGGTAQQFIEARSRYLTALCARVGEAS